MKIWLANPVDRTMASGAATVSRVQFGIPPVSGATPETTRETRVLPTAIENFRGK
jgi:hypothetical protein